MTTYSVLAYLMPIYTKRTPSNYRGLVKGGLGFTWIHSIASTQDQYIIKQKRIQYNKTIQKQLTDKAKYKLMIMTFNIKRPYIRFGVDIESDYQNMQFINDFDEFIKLANQKFV